MLHNRSNDDFFVQIGVAPIQKQKVSLPEHTGGSEKCEKEFAEYKNKRQSSEEFKDKDKTTSFQLCGTDQLESNNSSQKTGRIHKTSLNSLVDQLRPDTE